MKGFAGMSSRHRLWAVAALTVALVVASAGLVYRCVASESDGWEPGELVVLSGADQSQGRQREQLIAQWNLEHPDHPARIEPLYQETGDQMEAMELRTESDEQIDILNIDVIWTARFAINGLIRPIDTDRLPADFLDGFLDAPLNTCRYNDTLWALPFNTDAGLLFQRTDQAVPRNVSFDWKTLGDTTRQARQADPNLRAGLAGQFGRYEGFVVNTLEAMLAVDPDLIDEHGQLVVDRTRWTTALQPLRQAVRDKAVQLDGDEEAGRDAFRNRRVLFLRDWPVAYEILRPATDVAAPGAGTTQAVAPPTFSVTTQPGHSVLGGQNLAVTKKSKRPRAAQALIEYLTGPRSQWQLFAEGGLPATRGVVYEQPLIIKLRPYAADLRRAINTARPRPITPGYEQFQTVFIDLVRPAIEGNQDLPEDLETKIRDALRGK